jgi:shikimate kinase
MTHAVLVGLMGSGKSTVGALVAGRLGRVFVDVDVAITARTGRTVRELWEEGGETAYRQLESDEVLRVLRAGSPAVLAAPGGVVLDPAVRAALAGTVVWLRTSPSTLAAARGDLYEQVATAIVDTDGLVPDAVAEIVVGLLAGCPADT